MKIITYTLVPDPLIFLSWSGTKAQNSSNLPENTPQIMSRDEPAIPQPPNHRELERYISGLQKDGKIHDSKDFKESLRTFILYWDTPNSASGRTHSQSANESLPLLLVTIVLTACRYDITITSEQEKIEISAIPELSGHYSQFGIESKQRLEIKAGCNKRLQIAF